MSGWDGGIPKWYIYGILMEVFGDSLKPSGRIAMMMNHLQTWMKQKLKTWKFVNLWMKNNNRAKSRGTGWTLKQPANPQLYRATVALTCDTHNFIAITQMIT